MSSQHCKDKKKTSQQAVRLDKLEIFKHLVRKSRSTFYIRAVILNHLGLPRSGKTSFLRRMTGDLVNIKTARLAGEIDQPSTGILETKQPVLIRKSTTDVGTLLPNAWCVSNTLQEEESMMNDLFCQTAVEAKNIDPKIRLNDYVTPETHDDVVFLTIVPSTTSANSLEEGEMEEMASLLKDINIDQYQNYHRDQLFKFGDMVLLTNNDTGGHAEFMDLQAVLVQGPCFNLLYSRLVDDMDSMFKIHYTNEEGRSTDKEDSAMTGEEVLFQALSSITSSSLGDESVSATRGEYMKNSKTKAMFIGTHYDLVSEEEFKKKDKRFQMKVKNTDFYRKDIIEYATDDQLMLAVDNMNGDPSEIEKIRKILERVIYSFPRVPIPVAWLVLSLYLRKKFQIVSLKKCEELAGYLQMSPEELQDALWFLHHCVGVVLYYPEVEAMKDTVICQMQVVFDSASNLIHNTFSVEKVGHRASEEFKEKGQFSQKDLKDAVKKATEKSDSLIPLDNLVELLQHLNVLTIVPQKQSVSSSTDSEPTYFMPCVLKNAQKSELDIPSLSHQEPPPLMIRFNCGYSPVGVFPAMITNLVSQHLKDWRMIEEGLRKNRIQFYVGDDYDKISLVSHPRYFEIVVSRFEGFSRPTEDLCAHVRTVVQSTLDTVASRMNSNFNMEYKYGFECPHHPGREHLCVLTSEKARYMECLQDPKRRELVDVEDGHKAWFPTAGCHTKSPLSTSPNLDHEARKRQHPSTTDPDDNLKKSRLSSTDHSSPAQNDIPKPSPYHSHPPRTELHSILTSCQPSLQFLYLMRWKDEHGNERTFRLINEVSAKWKKFGRYLRIDSNVLDGWERQYQQDCEECWMKVMEHWLAGGCAYQNTWKGLCDLLRDLELSAAAKKIEAAVEACMY